MPDLSPPHDCASDLVLDRLLSGSLAEDAATQLHAHMDDCAQCRRRHAEMSDAHATFLRAHPDLDALGRAVARERTRARPTRSAASVREGPK